MRAVLGQGQLGRLIAGAVDVVPGVEDHRDKARHCGQNTVPERQIVHDLSRDFSGLRLCRELDEGDHEAGQSSADGLVHLGGEGARGIEHALLPDPVFQLVLVGDIGRDIVKALGNINYVWLLVAYFFLSMMIGLREGLRMYVNTFYWGFNSEQLSLFIIGSFAGYLTAFILAPRLHGRIDKKRTIIIFGLIYTVTPAFPLILGMMGILTQSTPLLLPIVIAFSTVAYGAVAILQISVMSALADIADQNELKHGIRQEGMLYSTRAFAAKMDQAIGAALAGFVITFIHFPAKAKPGEIPADVMHNLALWDGVLAAIPGLIAMIFYAKYNINRASYEATKLALTEHRATARAAAVAEQVRPPRGAAPAPAE